MLFSVIVFSAQAAEIKIWHCKEGACPIGAPQSNNLIITPIYVLSNNKATKFADWVAYRVTRSTIGTSADHNRSWKGDPLLAEEVTLEPKDYKGASKELSIDRGHQAPLAAFSGTVYWRITNYLSNITPQKKNLNQGAWKRLEGKVRDAAYYLNGVYVLTGTLYERELDDLPKADEDHELPSGYWKVILKGSKAIGFIMDQGMARKDDECEAIVELSEIEQRTGLELFPEMGLVGDLKRSKVGC